MRQPRLLATFLVGTILSSIVALFELGLDHLSLRGAAAILAGGAVFGFCLAPVARFARAPSAVVLLAWATVAGAGGGVAWWFVVRPASSLVSAAIFGGVFAILLFAVEGRFGRAAA